MHRIFLLGAFLLAFDCSAQRFTKVYSAGENLLQFNNVAPISDGGWYAAGYARNDTDFVAFLTKFDGDGNLAWSQKPAETRDPRALVTLNDGSAFFFNNNGGFQGYFDASLLHIGADGSFISETIWGKPEDQDDWFDARKFDNGEVMAIGMSRESSSFSERILLAKFTATGAILWEKTYDGGIFGRFSKILPLPSGDFYALGQYFNNGVAVGLLGKFTANGTLLWVKSYDYGAIATYFLAGQALSDGSVFVAAYQTNQNGLDIKLTLLNINASGAITSQKTLQNAYNLGPISMGIHNNDTLLIAAVSSGQVFPVVDNDNVILQVSPQGDLLGTLAFGSDAQDFGTDAFFTNNQMIICGMADTSADGSAQRAFVSKSGLTTSCCKKNIVITAVASPPLPIISDLPFTSSTVPLKQNHSVALADFPLSGVVSCQSPEGAKLLPANTGICIGDTLVIGLLSSPPADILWNTGATTREIRVDAPGTYTVALSGECGVANDTIQVAAIGNRVTAQVSPTANTCPGESITLSASGGASFLWSDLNGVIASSLPNLIVNPEQSTSYQVIVSDGQCRDTAAVAVTVLTAPVVSAGPDVSIKSGAQASLKGSGAVAYFWSPETGLSCTDCPAPLANPATTTTYTLLGTAANGCSDTASVTVFVQEPCPFYIPNVFSPDQSTTANNNLFGVFSREIPLEDFFLRIYSRWGELVFESRDPETPWNGTYRNQAAPPGVYLYQLEMSNCDGLVKKSGDVTLIR